MEQETLAQKVVHALVFAGICAAIVVIGWNEPLRYRFLSREEIFEIENPAPDFVPAPPTPGEWMKDPKRKTLLDAPSRPVRGGVNSFQTKPGMDRLDNRY